MFKQFIIWILMLLYLYTLTFDLFLNQNIRIPSPLLFCYPLILFFGNIKANRFLYGKEFLWFFAACFIYYLIGQEDIKSFAVNLFIVISCGLYFNFFIGTNRIRFNSSILLFITFLFLSAIIMMLNHMYPAQIDLLRSKLIGSPIAQSPSGIASAIFIFGYQLAAFTSFVFIYSLKLRWNVFFKIVVFSICLALIYFGMQRSVIVGFLLSSLLFFIFYYKSRFVFVLGIGAIITVILTTFISYRDLTSTKSAKYDNIFAKTERNAEKGQERGNLVSENLKIYAKYPFGLIFYGKTWSQVTRRSLVYQNGLTSHNAYLMFLTYLGPFLGLIILLSIYKRIIRIFKNAILQIKDPEKTLLIGLCFAFLSVSLNALFHNEWLIGASGPAIFLYFSILHLDRLDKTDTISTRVNKVIEMQDISY